MATIDWTAEVLDQIETHWQSGCVLDSRG